MHAFGLQTRLKQAPNHTQIASSDADLHVTQPEGFKVYATTLVPDYQADAPEGMHSNYYTQLRQAFLPSLLSTATGQTTAGSASDGSLAADAPAASADERLVLMGSVRAGMMKLEPHADHETVSEMAKVQVNPFDTKSDAALGSQMKIIKKLRLPILGEGKQQAVLEAALATDGGLVALWHSGNRTARRIVKQVIFPAHQVMASFVMCSMQGKYHHCAALWPLCLASS